MIQNDLRLVGLHRDHCVHDVDDCCVLHVHPNRLRLVVGEVLGLDSVDDFLGLADAGLDSDSADVVRDLVGLHDLRDHYVGRDLVLRLAASVRQCDLHAEPIQFPIRLTVHRRHRHRQLVLQIHLMIAHREVHDLRGRHGHCVNRVVRVLGVRRLIQTLLQALHYGAHVHEALALLARHSRRSFPESCRPKWPLNRVHQLLRPAHRRLPSTDLCPWIQGRISQELLQP